MTTTRIQPGVRRGKLFYFFVGTSLVLAVVCCCLVVPIILLRSHFSACVVSAGETNNEVSHAVSDMESASKEPWASDYRLPSDTDPLHYELILHPDLNNFTFKGSVNIQIQVKAARSFLLVNTKFLDIYDTKLAKLTVQNETESDSAKNKRTGDETEIEIKDAFEYKPNEFWVIRMKNDSELHPGIYSLRLQFRGNLTGKIVGFYRSIYTDPATQEKRKIATSKFQPTYARQAYPCFDEPGFKSTFKIRLVKPMDGYIALSNMDQVAETKDDPETGLTTVEFRESVPMVTYLSCFIVCDFKRLEPVTITQGFPFSVYATPGQVNKTKYALEVGVKITEFYIQYFGIPYPLPKLDMIAIPDFVSGAMEHWGLVTFREVNLLYEEGISSTVNKQRVASVVGHELAHMWFGNLMTLKWWDDLWLNEGFASYIEYKGVNHAHPDWHMEDQFLTEDLHRVMVLDASETSHPIVQTVGHPDEITELFDTISYSKGASVIRMLEDFLGEKEFRDGITAFLNKFKFANAVTQDLWNELQTVAKGVNVTQVMDTWTRQMGYPVVTATRDHNGAVTLKQSRFLTESDNKDGYKWDIPISYITSKSNSVQRTWLNSDNESITLQIPRDVAWFKVNCHQKGYYRVNYNEENWSKIIDLLNTDPTALHSTDRAHLLDDVFSLAEAGILGYETAMQMTGYLKNESDYVPWKVAANKFNELDRVLISTTFYAKFRKYLACLLPSLYKKVTMVVSEDDPHLKRLLRPMVAHLACHVGVQECIDETIAMFKNWINNVETAEKPHPDIRSLVYGQGMKLSGGEREWDIMWNLYLNETDAQERIKLLNGLAHSSEPWIMKRYIELAKDEANVRSQDFFSVLSFISHNPVGTPIVWDFIRDEWQYLVDRFTLNDRYLGRMIPIATSSFTSQLKLKEMETFFKEYPDAGAGKTGRSQALDHVRKYINWLKNHSKSLEEWINKEDMC